MKFQCSDEDGFVALVNAKTYKGFVAADWQLNQLLQHFVAQMHAGSLLIWATNEDGGNLWTVAVLEVPSANEAFREFSAPILVTDNCLYLVSYTDLTMVAQFEEEVLPAKHNAHLKIPLPNGQYQVTVRQMFNPGNFNYEETTTHFEIVFHPEKVSAGKRIQNVFWWPE